MKTLKESIKENDKNERIDEGGAYFDYTVKLNFNTKFKSGHFESRWETVDFKTENELNDFRFGDINEESPTEIYEVPFTLELKYDLFFEDGKKSVFEFKVDISDSEVLGLESIKVNNNVLHLPSYIWTKIFVKILEENFHPAGIVSSYDFEFFEQDIEESIKKFLKV